MSFTDPGFGTMSLEELKSWLSSNDLSAASYSELLNQLTVDLPTALPGVVQSSIGGSSGSVTPPAQGSTLEWDANQQLYVPAPAEEWTNYTPSVSSTSGSITSYTVQTANYLELSSPGLLVVCWQVNLVNIGTASGELVVSLPAGFTSRNFVSGIARENNVTGKWAGFYMFGGQNGTHMDGSTLDGASSWVNGYSWGAALSIPI